MSNQPFVHLHCHSHYSLLDGLQKVPQMLDRALELGMDAIAMTDHGTLSGTIEFYNQAKKKGVKPIIGLEAYVAPRRMHRTGPVSTDLPRSGTGSWKHPPSPDITSWRPR